MSNPERLLLALDALLDHRVNLVLYGRSAVWLGFDDPPPAVGATKDVDAIIRMSQLDELVNDEQFWDSRDAVNEQFKGEDMYITHLFQENQVFLRPDWLAHIVPLAKPVTRQLDLFRPATIDLILTKMMRGNDEWDMQDIEFMLHHDKISLAVITQAMNEAVIPDEQEYRDAFEKARVRVLELARQAGYP
ncbi:MAG: hypothetical protein IPK22_15450 [Verrucomicrobiaceae bacterium]|nr:hypothetical protein [Verrucomicrobiaceae bacterium]